jgi:hypothetical protein
MPLYRSMTLYRSESDDGSYCSLGLWNHGFKNCRFTFCSLLSLRTIDCRLGNLAYCGHIVKIFDSDLKQLDTVCERIRHDEDQLYRDGLIESPKFLVSCMFSVVVLLIRFFIISLGPNLVPQSTRRDR